MNLCHFPLLHCQACSLPLVPPRKPILKDSVQWLSRVQLFVTPWTAACQASLSTDSRHLLKFMSVESLLLSVHLILCLPCLLLPSVFPSIRVFSSESVLCIKWPKYWSFSISPSNEYSELISFRVEWLDLLAVQEFPALSQKQNLLLTVPFLVLRLSWAFSEVFSEDGRSRGMGSDLLRHFPCRRLLAWPIFP